MYVTFCVAAKDAERTEKCGCDSRQGVPPGDRCTPLPEKGRDGGRGGVMAAVIHFSAFFAGFPAIKISPIRAWRNLQRL
jgi:hypothetical protein